MKRLLLLTLGLLCACNGKTVDSPSDGAVTAEADTTDSVPAGDDPELPPGCPPHAPALGAPCPEVGLLCRYSETCPRVAMVAKCVSLGPKVYFEVTGVECSTTETPDGGTRADGCPLALPGGMRCSEVGKVCLYDDECPTVRHRFTCEKRPDGEQLWGYRDDVCPM